MRKGDSQLNLCSARQGRSRKHETQVLASRPSFQGRHIPGGGNPSDRWGVRGLILDLGLCTCFSVWHLNPPPGPVFPRPWGPGVPLGLLPTAGTVRAEASSQPGGALAYLPCCYGTCRAMDSYGDCNQVSLAGVPSLSMECRELPKVPFGIGGRAKARGLRTPSPDFSSSATAQG